MLPAVVRRLDEAGIVAAELALRLPSLDEVFLTLTGHHAEDQGPGANAADRRSRERGMTAAAGHRPRPAPSAGQARRAARIGARQALANALTLAWRNVTQLKHSPEKLIDVTLMPIVFLVLFLYVFGGAVAGSTHAYLELLLPGLVGADGHVRDHGPGHRPVRGHPQGRVRPVPQPADRAVLAADRRGARRHGAVLRRDGGADRVRLGCSASGSTPARSRCWPRSPWPTCSTWRSAGSRC